MTPSHDDQTVTMPSLPGRAAEAHASACVVVIHGERLGRRADIGPRRVVVGRARDVDLYIPHASVSRHHCEFWRDGDDYFVRDLGATNPTRVNDEVTGCARLADGDHVAVGECLLKFISECSVEARYHAEIHQLATNDPLTGLPNRRHFDEGLDKALARFDRHGLALSVCLVDVDNFKLINDRHGHAAGDEALRQLAAVLRSHVRGDDFAARIGGEEFAVALPECSADDAATRFAERLRAAIATARVLVGGELLHLTVSIGIAGAGPGRATRASLLQAADSALYRAKDEGRNCVRVTPIK